MRFLVVINTIKTHGTCIKKQQLKFYWQPCLPLASTIRTKLSGNHTYHVSASGNPAFCQHSVQIQLRPFAPPLLFPASSRSHVLAPVLCIWQYGGVFLHVFFPCIVRHSSTPRDLATSFQTSFCWTTSLLHAQPTAILSHACTLPGQCLYICSVAHRTLFFSSLLLGNKFRPKMAVIIRPLCRDMNAYRN